MFRSAWETLKTNMLTFADKFFAEEVIVMEGNKGETRKEVADHKDKSDNIYYWCKLSPDTTIDIHKYTDDGLIYAGFMSKRDGDRPYRINLRFDEFEALGERIKQINTWFWYGLRKFQVGTYFIPPFCQ